MRLAIAAHTAAHLGGTETYLAAIIPALVARGHGVAFCCEALAESAEAMALPDGVPRWRLPEAMEFLRAWRPDVVFVHGLRSPRLEASLLGLAPAVLFAHSYYGTCISGSKTWSVPRPVPCTRRFGPACLAHFYPHRCGGLGPASLVRGYRVQARRLALLPRYRAIAVFSEHMRAEYARHGLGHKVVTLPAVAPAAP
ncbi:MAG TPA: glycosyltransferase, partial [Vicinamibacterales bacterium]|nr:glycosyltransferase [Vicinamibacterales bacterium]